MTSWVVIDRFVEEERARDAKYRKRTAGRPLRSAARGLTDDELLGKLRSLGVEMDRATLDLLSDDALSAQEIAGPLIEAYNARTRGRGRFESDWIWICVEALWARWFPARPSFEQLDDKMQAGYEISSGGDAAAACRVWLEAWKDVLGIIDKAGIESIDEFDDLFAGTQAVFNWIQNLEDELWNARLADPRFLADRIAVCEEGLKRFEAEDLLLTQNRRRALAESWFELGEVTKADALYRDWLTTEPLWGWGWIGWSDCYRFTESQYQDLNRTEELLLKGLSIAGVEDRRDLVDRLSELYEEQGRVEEAAEIQKQAPIGRTGARDTVYRFLDNNVARQTDEVSVDDVVRHTDEVSVDDNVVRQKTTITFGEEGLPLDESWSLAEDLRKGSLPAGRKVGRNEPCPCGSGKKFKKCCGR